MAPRLKPFLTTLIENAAARGCNVRLETQTEPELTHSAQIEVTQYADNLPNCIIIDNRQLWLSADLGFAFNRGMTFRLDHPELIKQFKAMLLATQSDWQL